MSESLKVERLPTPDTPFNGTNVFPNWTQLFSIQFYLMHTKTKMNILFKNEMDIANYLEEKNPGRSRSRSRRSRMILAGVGVGVSWVPGVGAGVGVGNSFLPGVGVGAGVGWFCWSRSRSRSRMGSRSRSRSRSRKNKTRLRSPG